MLVRIIKLSGSTAYNTTLASFAGPEQATNKITNNAGNRVFIIQYYNYFLLAD
jgi:hypothetical protein